MTSVLNLEFVKELNDADPDLLSTLFESFSVSSVQKIATIESLLTEKKWDEFRKTCHSLRSSSLNLGAQALPDVLLRMETFKAGEEENLNGELALAKEELEKMKAEILKLIA